MQVSVKCRARAVGGAFLGLLASDRACADEQRYSPAIALGSKILKGWGEEAGNQTHLTNAKILSGLEKVAIVGNTPGLYQKVITGSEMAVEATIRVGGGALAVATKQPLVATAANKYAATSSKYIVRTFIAPVIDDQLLYYENIREWDKLQKVADATRDAAFRVPLNTVSEDMERAFRDGRMKRGSFQYSTVSGATYSGLNVNPHSDRAAQEAILASKATPPVPTGSNSQATPQVPLPQAGTAPEWSGLGGTSSKPAPVKPSSSATTSEAPKALSSSDSKIAGTESAMVFSGNKTSNPSNGSSPPPAAKATKDSRAPPPAPDQGGVRTGSESALQKDGSRRIGGLTDSAVASKSGQNIWGDTNPRVAKNAGGVRTGSESALQKDGSRRIGGLTDSAIAANSNQNIWGDVKRNIWGDVDTNGGAPPEWAGANGNSGGVHTDSLTLQPGGSLPIGDEDDDQYAPPPMAMNTSPSASCLVDYNTMGTGICKDQKPNTMDAAMTDGGDFSGKWRDETTSCANPIRISPSGIAGSSFSGFSNAYCSQSPVQPVQYPSRWRAQLNCMGDSIPMEYNLNQLDANNLRLNVCAKGSCTVSQLTRCP